MTIQPATTAAAAAPAQQAKPETTTAEAPTGKATATPSPAVSVTISKQAKQLSNSPGYTMAEESTESAAAKAAELLKGQR